MIFATLGRMPRAIGANNKIFANAIHASASDASGGIFFFA